MPPELTFESSALAWIEGRLLESARVRWGYRRGAITDAWVEGILPAGSTAPPTKTVQLVWVQVGGMRARAWGTSVVCQSPWACIRVPSEDAAAFAEELGISAPADGP